MQPIRPFWDNVSPSDQSEILQIGHTIFFLKNDILLQQHERSNHVIVLRSGFVKVTARAGNGYHAVLAIRGAGDLVGELACVDGGPRSATLQAVTDVAALTITASRFAVLRRTKPAVERAVQLLLSRRLREADQVRAVAGAESVEHRLALALLHLGERYGVQQPDGSLRLGLPLSQDDLAGLALTSRRTIGRVLAQWRTAGWISTARCDLLLTDPRALATNIVAK